MKGFLLTILFIFAVLTHVQADVQMVTADGYAFLEDSTDNHSDIKVKFQALTPSAQTDSCYTDSTGYFSIGLAEGTYTVRYTRDGFKPYTQPEEYFLDTDLTLPDVTLKPGSFQEVSGTVSGLWDSYYDYYVVGDINVPDGQVLTIQPGVRVFFMGNFQLAIYGKLNAQGVEGDSIYFTSGQVPNLKGAWKNICFIGQDCDGSLMEYCVIEYGGTANNGELYASNTQYVNIQILNSCIRYSSRAGIALSNKNSLLINECSVYENNWIGALLDGPDSSSISKCLIYGNTDNGIRINSQSSSQIIQNVIFNNQNGIECTRSNAIIMENIIYNNYDGIIAQYDGYSPVISFNQIYSNINSGVYLNEVSAKVLNNTILYNNIAVEIQSGCSQSHINNNILYSNSNGIYAAESEPEIISYNNIFDNTSANLTGSYLPDNIGTIITTNANGDPSDTYYNIFLDPQMTDPDNDDFSLQATSPCIDAGDPALPKDPDNTIADIGALYYNQGGAAAPTSDFSADPLSGTAPLGIQFTPVTTGPVTGYLWNFGDGKTSTRAYPVHTYAAADTYTVSLQVTGPGGSNTEVKSDYIIVTPDTIPPTANFIASKTTAYPGETIQFTSQSTGDIDTYDWDFGDTGTSTEPNPAHAYATTGTYTVSLTVTGPAGTDTETKTDYIAIVDPEQVIAVFSPLQSTGIAPHAVQFSNQSTGSITSWLWDFGDTQTSTDTNPLHVYADTGSYTVELIVYGQINNDTTFGTVTALEAEPLIYQISDVPDDQGGKVTVKWQRSGYDGGVGATVNAYTIWEEMTTGWTALGSVNARQEAYYTYLATTVQDSSPDGTSWTHFRVTAHTGDPQVFYDSPVDSGYSVDNIAPEAPGNLMPTQLQNAILVQWDESTATDFHYFTIYRDDIVLAHTVDAEYSDADVTEDETYIYTVKAVDAHGNASAASDPLTVTFEPSATQTTYNQSFDGGWNMIGLPNDPTDTYYLNLYPNAVSGTLYGFAGTYIPEDSLQPGAGYWLRFDSENSSDVLGYLIESLTLDISEGWNMITGISGDLALSDVQDPEGIIIPNTLYGFDGSYVLEDSILQASGYWLRADTSGQIYMTLGSGLPLPVKSDYSGREYLASFQQLEISDALGHQQTLYLGSDERDTEHPLSYSLPPLPPENLFDARFDGDFLINTSDEALIHIQANYYPLTIRLNTSDFGEPIEYRLSELVNGAEAKHYLLHSGETITIPNSQVKSLRLEKDTGIPVEFIVYQNYPNPFNPTTEIKYGIPQDSKVELTIYNALGQKVRTLLSGNQKAGYHTVKWGGTNQSGIRLSSGIYFYRIHADKHQAIKKMILLK